MNWLEIINKTVNYNTFKKGGKMRQTIEEHEKTIKAIEGWIKRDREILMNRLEAQENDLLAYKLQLEKAKRKGLKAFVRAR